MLRPKETGEYRWIGAKKKEMMQKNSRDPGFL